jgi:single-strand DNA-binding protein
MGFSINKVMLGGNLTRDPEVKVTSASGMKIAKFGMAVNDRRKNTQTGDWEDVANFVDVTAFDKQAGVAEEYLAKGSPVFVEGRLRLEQWVNAEGERRSKLVVYADRITLLPKANSVVGAGAGRAAEPVPEDPFVEMRAEPQAEAVADPPARKYRGRKKAGAEVPASVVREDESIPF